MESVDQGNGQGRWKSRVVLRALDSIKRDQVFKSLKKANQEISISKKLASLNASPIVDKATDELEA